MVVSGFPADGWQRISDLPRVQAGQLSLKDVPRSPGVYAWFHQGSAVFAGKASGRGGLRARLRAHLTQGVNLNNSSLRRDVAQHVLQVPTSVTRQRPPFMTVEQVDHVNAWLELDSAEAAKNYERHL